MQVSIRFCNWPWITCKETQFVCASGLYVREKDLAVQQGQLPWLRSQPGPSPESLWQQHACCLRSVLSECQVVSTRLMWSKLGKVSSLRPLGNSLRVNQGQPPCGPFWGQVSGMCQAEAHRAHLAKGNPSVAVWREVPCWKAALVMGGEQASPSCPHGPVSPWDSDIPETAGLLGSLQEVCTVSPWGPSSLCSVGTCFWGCRDLQGAAFPWAWAVWGWVPSPGQLHLWACRSALITGMAASL